MPHKDIADLKRGEVIEEVYLVADKLLKSARNGSQYIQMRLQDRTGTIDGRIWNATEAIANAIRAEEFLRVRAKVEHYQGMPQLIVQNFTPLEDVEIDMTDFLPQCPQEIGELLARLRAAMDRVERPELQALVRSVLDDEALMDAFCRCPAGTRNHHAYQGGLLEHVTSVAELAVRAIDSYPQVDMDLLLVGVLLHDLGKVRELGYERVFTYTDEGQLLGHLVIAIGMLDEKLGHVADEMGEPVPEELVLRLKHMIVSHHGFYEFGSPKLPMTIEAIVLHHLDNLDAKIMNYAGEMQSAGDVDSKWTNWIPSLQRKLFKPSLNQ